MGLLPAEDDDFGALLKRIRTKHLSACINQFSIDKDFIYWPTKRIKTNNEVKSKGKQLLSTLLRRFSLQILTHARYKLKLKLPQIRTKTKKETHSGEPAT